MRDKPPDSNMTSWGRMMTDKLALLRQGNSHGRGGEKMESSKKKRCELWTEPACLCHHHVHALQMISWDAPLSLQVSQKHVSGRLPTQSWSRGHNWYSVIRLFKKWEIYFKKLAYVIVLNWQVLNLQGRLVGWRPREKLMLQLESAASYEAESFFLRRPHSFLLKVSQLTGQGPFNYGV